MAIIVKMDILDFLLIHILPPLSAISLFTTVSSGIWVLTDDSKSSLPIKTAILSFAVLVIALSSVLGVRFVMQTVVRNHVSETLQKMDVALVATINGKMAESEALLHELSKIQVIPAHNSGPTQRFVVIVQDENHRLELWFKRDSSILNEFWAYYPEYESMQLYSFARLHTEYFDEVSKRK